MENIVEPPQGEKVSIPEVVRDIKNALEKFPEAKPVIYAWLMLNKPKISNIGA